MLKKWLPIVFITLLAVFLILLKFDPGFFQRFSHKEKGIAINKPDKVVQQNGGYKTKHRDPYREPTFPFGRKVNEDFAKKYPDQFSIVNKMYYSWDYIHNAQGNYAWGHPLQGDPIKGHFYVDLDKNMNLVNLKISQNDKVQNEKVLYKNKLESSSFLLKKYIQNYHRLFNLLILKN